MWVRGVPVRRITCGASGSTLADCPHRHPGSFRRCSGACPGPKSEGSGGNWTNAVTPGRFVPSGGLDLILFCWDRHGTTDLLVMACEGMNNEMEAIALQPGPTDESNLILRAGPDAPVLRTSRVTLFGAGALGGHVGTALTESGLGSLDVVDGEVLLPEKRSQARRGT